MGIRFYCPNGHRLHVKSFLANKRGICPHCSARFRIPPESEIPRGSPKIKPNSRAAAGTTSAKNGKRQNGTVITAAVGTPAESKTVAESKSPHPAVSGDPISEAPDAIWYVRPPSGGQYGPAKGEVMRRWIEEGRVSADSLVWREGWSDWLTAGPVFPALNSSYTASATPAAKREAVSPQLQSAPILSQDASRTTAAAARPAPTQKSLAAVVILVLIVVALLAVLVFVLINKH